ncbi:CDP-diacylglycerol--glycerol-3-phosphate 3-phosphatidyltransferase [Varibaculum vaginae]|uniref:CDP-diacylglycerol--glycerol-3-phosphate 3-phosphatidyltransferase n=1 Tax=Varibaculum vaginae TaxID=2364797 RepID=UPI000F083A83|nr:CDP-diacylglycerol--glycerol-3-phosphate 3-phosphatidyltransferase [Varibaculum vaginae]
MESKDKTAALSEKSRQIIPNILTVVRIVLVPVFIVLMIIQFLQGTVTLLIIALIVFCAAAYTDHLDGRLARRWQVVSDFGKLVDPIADKALMISAFVLLSLFQNLWWWFTAVVILREIAVTVLRITLLRSGVVLPASKGGKIKTSLQILLVFLWMLAGICYPFNAQLGVVVMYLAIAALIAAFVATVLSGMVYFLDAHDNRKQQEETTGEKDTSTRVEELVGVTDSEEKGKPAGKDVAEQKDVQDSEKRLDRQKPMKNPAPQHAKISEVPATLKSEDQNVAAASETETSDEVTEEDSEPIGDSAGFKKTWIPRTKPGKLKPEADKVAESAAVKSGSETEKSADETEPALRIAKSAQGEEESSPAGEEEAKNKFPSRRQRHAKQNESSREENAAAVSPELKEKAAAPRFSHSRAEMRRRKKDE